MYKNPCKKFTTISHEFRAIKELFENDRISNATLIQLPDKRLAIIFSGEHCYCYDFQYDASDDEYVFYELSDSAMASLYEQALFSINVSDTDIERYIEEVHTYLQKKSLFFSKKVIHAMRENGIYATRKKYGLV